MLFVAEVERESFRMHLAMAAPRARRPAAEPWLSRLKSADGAPREVMIDLRVLPVEAGIQPLLWFLSDVE
jgi:hypothetical protein